MMNKKIRLKKGEVFKEIEGYKDRYYISNMGRLWSNVSGKFIGAKDKDKGYIQVSLLNEEGEVENTSIHREVGKAFVPNDDPENKVEINHKNYIRDDNRAENLEWTTHLENVRYSYDNVYTEENRDKFSKNLKKLWEDEDYRNKQVERTKKQWEDEDFRNKQAEGLKKKWEDEDFRKRKSEGMKRLYEDPNFLLKREEAVRKARQKPLLQYTKEGELVSKFSSGKEASEKTGIRQSSISNALTGRLKTAGGFKWEYDQ